MKTDIVTIGNITKEFVILNGKMSGPVLGGPCAYAGLALAKLEEHVGIVTHCAPEHYEEITEELRLLDLSGLHTSTHTTVTHTVYFGEQSKPEYFETAPLILFSSIPESYLEASTFIIGPMDYDVDLELAGQLRRLGKKVYVDLGGFGGTTSYNHFPITTKRGMRIIRTFCENAYAITASHDDLAYIMPDMTLEEQLAFMKDHGANIVLITLGDQGAVCLCPDGKLLYQAAYKPHITGDLNLTGAGDLMLGGFVYGMLHSDSDIGYAMKCGNSLASLILEEEGFCKESRMPVKKLMTLRMDGVI